jgi:hypothetical protein
MTWAYQFDNGGAIATPTGNGLLVVDIDPRNGGSVPSWAPRTRTVKTQSGGLHLYYSIDEDIKSRAGLFGRGVDSKCAGGYVLLPPSPGYEWVDLRPRASLLKTVVLSYAAPESRERTGVARRDPQLWERGMIHEQVVAWAAYFAGQLEDDTDVEEATWEMVHRAREAGTAIDNANNHIDGAIRWVLLRERAREDVPEVA